MYGLVQLWCALGVLEVRWRYALGTLEFGGTVRFGSVGAIRSAYYRLCVHVRSGARLGFVHVVIVATWKAPLATCTCMHRGNLPSFDRSIDTTLLESTCEEV